jgi:hypothetical protein
LPNPALVAEDRLDVAMPWAVVAEKMREKDIPIGDIDKGLYTEFLKMTEPELDVRLKRLSGTDELDKRKSEIANNTRKLNTNNTFTYTMPQETNPNVMYAKRFSHQFRNGYLLDTTTPGRDNLFTQLETQGVDDKKNNAATKARRKARRRCRGGCQWIIAILVLLGIGAGIMLLFHYKLNNGKKSASLGT